MICRKFAAVSRVIWQTGPQKRENLPQKTVVPKYTEHYDQVHSELTDNIIIIIIIIIFFYYPR